MSKLQAEIIPKHKLQSLDKILLDLANTSAVKCSRPEFGSMKAGSQSLQNELSPHPVAEKEQAQLVTCAQTKNCHAQNQEQKLGFYCDFDSYAN